MARKRRTSAVLELARQRLAGLKSVNPEPNFGGDLNVAAFTSKINGFTTRIVRHHLPRAMEASEEPPSRKVVS